MGNNNNREYTVPHMMNMSFDKEFQQNTVEIVGYVPPTTAGGDSALSRAVADTLDLLVDEASSTVTYIGEAAPGTATSAAVWRIFKVDTSSGTSLRYADGVNGFSKVWDDRATYSY